MRESLAVIVFALNWKNYIENKYVRYYIGVIVSMGFHISAAFLLILPMLKWIKLDYKYFLVLMSVCVLGWLMWPPKLPILSAIPMLETKMSGYLSHSSGGLLFSILVLIRYTIIPITVVFLLKKYYNNVQYENTLCALSLFGVFSIFSFVIFTRFINYFTPILVLAIAELIGKMFNSKYYSTRNTAGILVVIMFFAYASYYVHLDMYKRWWPYSSIINPVEYIRNQNE